MRVKKKCNRPRWSSAPRRIEGGTTGVRNISIGRPQAMSYNPGEDEGVEKKNCGCLWGGGAVGEAVHNGHLELLRESERHPDSHPPSQPSLWQHCRGSNPCKKDRCASHLANPEWFLSFSIFYQSLVRLGIRRHIGIEVRVRWCICCASCPQLLNSLLSLCFKWCSRMKKTLVFLLAYIRS